MSLAAVITYRQFGRWVRALFKSSMNAGERPGIVTEPILDDRQAEYGKAGRVAIGADDQIQDLRPQALDDVGEKRSSSERQQAFVAAAHAARSAGQQNADGSGLIHLGSLKL